MHKHDLSWLGQSVMLANDWKQVGRDHDVDIVVELAGVPPTVRTIVFAALDAGKDLVTANE